MIKPVRFALDHYRRLKDMAKRPSEVRIEQMPHTPEEEKDENENTAAEGDLLNSTSIAAPGDTTNRRISHENLTVDHIKRERSPSLRSSIASSRSSLILNSFDAISPVPDEVTDIINGITETEVDVMERTSTFKISTEAPITASQKSSFERRPSYDGRLSAEGKSCDSSESRTSRAEARVSMDGRGRDSLGHIGRLYSKEISKDSMKRFERDDEFGSGYAHRSLPVTNIVENEMENVISRKPALTKYTYSLDEDNNPQRNYANVGEIKASLSEQDESFLAKVKKLAGSSKRSSMDVRGGNLQKFSCKSNNDNHRSNMKRGRSKSVADQSNSNRTYSIAKSKINFKASQNPCTKTVVDETKLLGTTSKLYPSVQTSVSFDRKIKNTNKFDADEEITLASSPAHSDRGSCSSYSVDDKMNGGQKKFSLSLDMLPSRRNGKNKRTRKGTPQNTPASSEDNLINPQSNQQSQTPSPRTSKKHSDNTTSTSRNIIFSLLRRSTKVKKEEEQRQNTL